MPGHIGAENETTKRATLPVKQEKTKQNIASSTEIVKLGATLPQKVTQCLCSHVCFAEEAQSGETGSHSFHGLGECPWPCLLLNLVLEVSFGICEVFPTVPLWFVQFCWNLFQWSSLRYFPNVGVAGKAQFSAATRHSMHKHFLQGKPKCQTQCRAGGAIRTLSLFFF